MTLFVVMIFAVIVVAVVIVVTMMIVVTMVSMSVMSWCKQLLCEIVPAHIGENAILNITSEQTFLRKWNCVFPRVNSPSILKLDYLS